MNIQLIEKRDAIWILKDLFPGNFPSIKIVQVTEAEIKSQYLPKIKKKK
jgi:hypothetical protein